MTTTMQRRVGALESVRSTPPQLQLSKDERDRRFAAATAHIPDEQLSQIVRDMMAAGSSSTTSTGRPNESRD